jgi:hypothetical protein
MSAISYTAPIFTEEQEKKEKESITEEEILEVVKDVFGIELLIEETEELLATSLAQFAQELAAIHDERRRAIILRCENVPVLSKRKLPQYAFSAPMTMMQKGLRLDSLIIGKVDLSYLVPTEPSSQ